MIKFRTFKPYTDSDIHGHKVIYSATLQLNEWIEEHSDVEIISWQTTASSREDYGPCITIQYKEKD